MPRWPRWQLVSKHSCLQRVCRIVPHVPLSHSGSLRTSIYTCPVFGSEAGPSRNSSFPTKLLSVVLDTAPIVAKASARRRCSFHEGTAANCRERFFRVGSIPSEKRWMTFGTQPRWGTSQSMLSSENPVLERPPSLGFKTRL